jgi:hypothetical protein
MLNTVSSNQSHEITSTERVQAYSTQPLANGMLSNKHTSNESSLGKVKFNFDIQVAALKSTKRNEIEQFIKKVFQKVIKQRFQ